MKRLFVYVEGQTEETFARDLLSPHLAGQGVLVTPVLARTKRTKSGHTFKGGIVSYAQVRRDLIGLLGDTSAVLVTTMIDYYGLPDDFPGRRALAGRTPGERVEFLEEVLRREIDHPRFLPFLTLHEFEALLFAQPQRIVETFPHVTQAEGLLKEVSGLSPEEVNEGHDTHPAARISRYIPGYRKPLHGPLIARRIGLETIRARCPHFNRWLDRLENL